MTVQGQVQPQPTEGSAAAPPASKFSVKGATLWTLGGEAAAHALRIGSSLVLTRLLDPKAFGIMAVVQVFSHGLNMFSDLGIRPIIIRHERGDDPAFLNTIWTVRLVRGAIMALAFCAIAWPVSMFYEESLLGLIMPVASLTLFIEGLLSTKFFSHERHLSRARPTLITVISSAAGIAFMIAGAWVFRSVWALVWGGVVATLVRVFLSHVALPGPANRFHWDPETWKEVSHFGKWVFLNSIVTFFALQMDKLVFAKLIELEWLGVYAIAVNIVMLPTTAARAIGASVVFPSYSRALKRPEDQAVSYRRMGLLLLLGGGAAVSFLILNGPWLIALLYDPRYEAAGWILQLVSIAGWFIILEISPGFMLLALGRPRWLTVASVVKILAWAVTVPWAFHLWGFTGALLAGSLVEGIRYVLESLRVRAAGMKFYKTEGAITLLVLGSGAAAWLIQRGPLAVDHVVARAAVCVAVFLAIWTPVGLRFAGRLRKLA